ncbi:MotA/TolQ/ExbB proton channel family protein [Vibrio albus]|nr:MotA/TolQ/ExbB proton channel family protein [Vibrio albus]
MSRGGPVLWWLALAVALFWLIAFERLLYLYVSFPRRRQTWICMWQKRADRHSWFARQQRAAWLSQAHIELTQHLNLLKVLVTLFPMIGLLGTVTGMISVFDVLEAQGTSQPRLMAGGISMATLPTMAGMVAALAGMFTYSRLSKMSESRELHLERLMRAK